MRLHIHACVAASYACISTFIACLLVDTRSHSERVDLSICHRFAIQKSTELDLRLLELGVRYLELDVHRDIRSTSVYRAQRAAARASRAPDRA
ncbi:hypothetical protein BD626DRAFT_276526 [Schizophyllum amplum]|uniref:Uncharacterized protein n=1 Tax=Schizophyllum amplum TaxID=97359 RepID=A0A550BTJ3_9AGAR|nr:hypothetical protein BD626DRAFT_276526 [Auriculariopsis ampla]